VDPATVTLLGRLSPLFIPVSGFVLHPFVGCTGTRPEFRAQPGEVERILEIPLDALREPSCLGAEERHLLDAPRRVRFFRLDGETVWGATAMVLAEFLCILGDPPPPPET
jgi:hypothetical protein